jgi:hypothetical protein
VEAQDSNRKSGVSEIECKIRSSAREHASVISLGGWPGVAGSETRVATSLFPKANPVNPTPVILLARPFVQAMADTHTNHRFANRAVNHHTLLLPMARQGIEQCIQFAYVPGIEEPLRGAATLSEK